MDANSDANEVEFSRDIEMFLLRNQNNSMECRAPGQKKPMNRARDWRVCRIIHQRI